MSDEVIFQDRKGPSGDPLDQENLSKRRAQSNSTHYVERGLGLTPDYANDDVKIGSGHAVIRDERGAEPKAYDVFPDARTGADAINLTDGAVNELYLVIDPATNDDVWYDARTDGTEPSKPSLHMGTVDMGAKTTDTVSEAPEGEFLRLAFATEKFRIFTETVNSSEELVIKNANTGSEVRIDENGDLSGKEASGYGN